MRTTSIFMTGAAALLLASGCQKNDTAGLPVYSNKGVSNPRVTFEYVD